MTVVTAMLAWYDEDPEILYRAVRSAAVIADRVVAADGRWNYYPGNGQPSPKPQYDAIRRACMHAGLDLSLHLRHDARTWTGQVQKRNHLLYLAQGSDWVMPLDADWEIKGERAPIRHQLEHTTADAMVVPFYTPHNHDANLADVAATNWHEELAGNTILEPFIYRYLDDIRIDDYHWQYSGITGQGTNRRRVALWGTHHPPAVRQGLQDMAIVHWCLHRNQRTILANRAYCDQRDKYTAHHGREP